MHMHIHIYIYITYPLHNNHAYMIIAIKLSLIEVRI